jgi:hypothetical protein
MTLASVVICDMVSLLIKMLDINREMHLSPRAHYMFLSISRIQDERLPIEFTDLLNYFVADFMILIAEAAAWT